MQDVSHHRSIAEVVVVLVTDTLMIFPCPTESGIMSRVEPTTSVGLVDARRMKTTSEYSAALINRTQGRGPSNYERDSKWLEELGMR
jgi:hypothetical protein